MRQVRYTQVELEEGAQALMMRTVVLMVTDWCRLTNRSSGRVEHKCQTRASACAPLSSTVRWVDGTSQSCCNVARHLASANG
jgi:hypothetical protein